jgi:simple sugar transport system ATP-binding protein
MRAMPLSPAAHAAPHGASTPDIRLRGISVAFGSVVALEDVDLHLAPGTRHAVVGENGAGKSTLMKALFGLLSPDAGEILVGGTARRLSSPADAIALGVGMVHQHFELIPPFTVAENVVLGAETTRGPLLDRKQAEEQVRALAAESGLPIDPAARVEDLSVASQQRVEILKALYRRARVLILDEPTAVLAPGEARDLWAATARLSAAGATVVFITHKLDEVMAHADAVTVLRRGRRVLSKPVAETSAEELAGAMVGTAAVPSPLRGGESGEPEGLLSGRPADEWCSPPLKGEGPGEGTAILSVRDLTVRGRRGETAVEGAAFDLRAGEIVGLAGVDGSGQVELIEALFGLRRAASGTVTLEGKEIGGLSVAERRAAGIGYVPEDRHHRALVLPFSCEENAVLGRHREGAFAGAMGVLKGAAMRAFLTERAGAFDVRGAAPGVPARALSGGNQQKLVMARELSRQPRVLLASQPTRGLDFAASRFVHDALRAERDRGVAVLVQSLDLDEVLALSDRVAVMLRGRIVAVLPRAEATEARVGALMTGAA